MPGTQKVQVLRSTVAGHVLSAGQILPGELAANLADKKLFLGDAGSSPIDVQATIIQAALSTTALTGLSLATATAITAADNLLPALGKLQAQITLRAPLASPALTGAPTSATAPAARDNTTKIPNTAWVQGELIAPNIAYTAPGTGGAVRTAQTKLAEAVSILDFGADPTGAVDAAGAFANAIAASSGLVRIPAGTYKLSSTVSVTKGVRLVGDGRGVTTIVPGAAVTAFAVNTTAPFAFEGVLINYGGPQNAGLAAITVTAATQQGLSVFRDMQIAAADTGIRFTNSCLFTMDNVFIENFAVAGVDTGNAFALDNGDSVITNCVFFNYLGQVNTSGVIWRSGGGLRVVNNKFGALTYGVYFAHAALAGATAQLLVANNSFDTMSGAAVVLTRLGTNTFNSVIIANNVMPDCGSAVAVPHDATGPWLSFLLVHGNTWIGAATGSPVGFSIDSVTGFAVTDNTLFSNNSGTVGITIGSAAARGSVQGNNLGGVFATTVFSGGVLVRVLDNIGANPVGPTVPSVGASPWTYTASGSPTTLYLSATTGITSILQNATPLFGAAIGANVPATVQLGPFEAVTVTYTGTLSALAFIH